MANQEFEPENIDEELQEILDGLDDEGDDDVPPQESTQEADEEESVQVLELPVATGAAEKDPPPTSTMPTTKSFNFDEMLEKVMGDYSEVKAEIWQAIKQDRVKIDTFLTLFQERISEVENAKSVYVEAIASLLATKASTAMNSTRLLDSMAKMTTALKGVIDKEKGADMNLNALLNDNDDNDDSDGFDENAP